MAGERDEKIAALRDSIDEIDGKILKLFARRGTVAHRIGCIKKAGGIRVYTPSREKQIFDRLAKMNAGPYGNPAVFSVFREIISATRALEEPTRVAFLGPTATFTHFAAVEHFGRSAAFLPQPDIAEVFEEVGKGHADFGVVPVENSTEGVVNYTLDKFVESELKICSEIIVAVSHNLLSVEKDVARITTVYSHPQALAQCRGWLTAHLPGVKCVDAESTAQAAKRVAKAKKCAAVASRLAADMYGLNILAGGIQDEPNNFTRFLVIGHAQAEASGNDKTSVAFFAKDRVGVLYHLLQPLAENGINLTKIESRPLKKRVWEYMFFVDMDGHAGDPKIRDAIGRLREECEFFKVLGSYPKSVQAITPSDQSRPLIPHPRD